jgi:putative addiction module component (TIGR02574 family)
MTAQQKQIVDAAMALPAEARAQLAEQLLDSLDPARSEIDAAWAKEVELRIREVEEGRAELVPNDQIFVGARQRLERLKGG